MWRVRPYCGDGMVNGPEQCDEGDDNTGEYGGCNPDCTLALPSARITLPAYNGK